MKYLFVWFFSFMSFAQYDCSISNPIEGEQFRAYNKSINECDNWFNENIQGFKCNGTCTLITVDNSATYTAIEAKKLIEKNKIKGGKVITHIQYLNDTRAASNETKLAFGALQSVKDAESWLNRGRLDIAQTIIQNAEVDGTLITTELKAAIISYIEGL